MPHKMLPFAVLTLGLFGISQAETLNMPPPAQNATATPAQSQATESSGGYSVTLPGRGMTMIQVEEKFGPPLEKHPEVGEPPITRWDYDDFSVYFEYQYVINAVVTNKQPR